MQLNNYLQSNGGTRLLQWEVSSTGPPHSVQWTVTTYSKYQYMSDSTSLLMIVSLVRGIEYARCIGSRQGATMENAARQTLDALVADRSRRSYYY